MRQPGPCLRALCEAVAVLLSKNMTCARPRCNATPSEDLLHSSHPALHTSHLQFALHTSSHLKSCELCSARQKALTVREKSLAQKNDWAQKLLHTDAWDTDAFTQKAFTKYSVLQSLHEALPSNTLYYKACTKHFPVLQSLHRALPSTTL